MLRPARGGRDVSGSPPEARGNPRWQQCQPSAEDVHGRSQLVPAAGGLLADSGHQLTAQAVLVLLAPFPELVLLTQRQTQLHSK